MKISLTFANISRDMYCSTTLWFRHLSDQTGMCRSTPENVRCLTYFMLCVILHKISSKFVANMYTFQKDCIYFYKFLMDFIKFHPTKNFNIIIQYNTYVYMGPNVHTHTHNTYTITYILYYSDVLWLVHHPTAWHHG